MKRFAQPGASDSELLDFLRGSELGASLLSQRDATLAARRAALVEEREAALVTLVKELPALAGNVAKARAAAELSKKAHDDAVAVLASALGAERIARHNFDSVATRSDSELRLTSDPAIDAFVAELRDEIEATSRARRSWASGHARLDGTRRASNNFEQIEARITAIRSAIVAAGELKLSAVAGTTSALSAIRDGVPTIEGAA